MLTAVALGIVTAALAVALMFVGLTPATARLLAVLALCLTIVAVVSRSLLGYAGGAEASAPESPRSRLLMSWPVVALAAVLPYLHGLSIGLLSDDFALITGAGFLKTLWQAWRWQALPIFYRPLFGTYWWAGLRLWGGTPLGYHAASLLLHAANAALVFALGRRLSGSRSAGFIAGLLFAVHPLHVEPVLWACSASDLLCTVFSLLSLLALENALDAASRRARAGWLLAALACFALALTSKEAALALPGVAALRVFLHQKWHRWRAAAAWAAPYALVLVVYLAVRVGALSGMGGYHLRTSIWTLVLPPMATLDLTSFALPLHAGLFEALGSPWFYRGAVGVLAFGVFWWMRGLTRVPGRPLRFYLGFILLALVPAWMLPPTTPYLEGSRFSYFATIGLAWMFGHVCAGRGIRSRTGGVGLALVLLLSAGLTAWYVTPWQQAGRSTERVIASASSLLTELERRGPVTTLYVQDLPDGFLGAQVLRNGLPNALSIRLRRPVPVQVVSHWSGLSPEVLAASVLGPGEYVAAWDEEAGRFRLVREGGRP